MPRTARLLLSNTPHHIVQRGHNRTSVFADACGYQYYQQSLYNGDDLFAYKWRDYKIHFVELGSMFDAAKKLNMPRMHNLIMDPKELYPLDKIDVAEAWFMPAVLEKLVAHKKTLVMEPPIRLGTLDPYVPAKR